MNWGNVLDSNWSSFSDDEKLNYGLKIALSRLQTELGRAWYQEPKDFAPKGPETVYKKKLPSYSEIESYFLIDPYCKVDGVTNQSVITNVTVGDVLNNSSKYSGYSFGDIDGSKDFFNVGGSVNIRTGSENITDKTVAQEGLSYKMFTRYRYWENGLTGKNSNTDGSAGSSLEGTYSNKKEPENAIMSYTGGSLSATRRWVAYDSNLGKDNDEDKFFKKLETYSSPIKIIKPSDVNTSDYTDITKANDFLEIYIQVPTISTRQTADTANTTNSGSLNGTDNIGFFNPVMRKSLGDVEGFKYVIRGWGNPTANMWNDFTIESGKEPNILYYLNNPGFILCYGIKNIIDGLGLSYAYPPLISFLKYTGETFSDGIISQGETLPEPSLSLSKDLFINTSDNTINRFDGSSWVAVGGSGGSGGGGGTGVGGLPTVKIPVGNKIVITKSDLSNLTKEIIGNNQVYKLNSGFSNSEVAIEGQERETFSDTNGVGIKGYDHVHFNPHIKINNSSQTFTVKITVNVTNYDSNDSRMFYAGTQGRTLLQDYVGSTEHLQVDDRNSFNYNLAYEEIPTAQATYTGTVGDFNPSAPDSGITTKFDPGSEMITIIFLPNYLDSPFNQITYIESIEIESNQDMYQIVANESQDKILTSFDEIVPRAEQLNIYSKLRLGVNDVYLSSLNDSNTYSYDQSPVLNIENCRLVTFKPKLSVKNTSLEDAIPSVGYTHSTTAAFKFGDSVNQYGLAIGTFRSPGTSWIQAKQLYTTNPDHENRTFKLAINPLGGNVGIGTDDPYHKLEISDGLNYPYSSSVHDSGPNDLALLNINTSSWASTIKIVGSHSHSVGVYDLYNTQSSSWTGNSRTDGASFNRWAHFSYYGDLYFRHYYDSGNTNNNRNVLILKHDGKVGIGKTPQYYELEVDGHMEATGSISSGNDMISGRNLIVLGEMYGCNIRGMSAYASSSSDYKTITTDGYYRILKSASTSQRICFRCTIVELNSGKHSSTTFLYSHHYGSTPSFTLLNRSAHNDDSVTLLRYYHKGTYDETGIDIWLYATSKVKVFIDDNYQSGGIQIVDFELNPSISGFTIEEIYFRKYSFAVMNQHHSLFKNRVGIGLSPLIEPAYPLEVTGYKANVGYTAYMNSARFSTSDGSNHMCIFGDYGIATDYAFYITSDRRIKKNIVDVPDNLALQQVRNIPCRYYEYKDDVKRGPGKTIGFIAQEVKEILPMAVSLERNFIPNEMRSLDNISWEEIIDSSNNGI